jgi:AraC-like DNA-binding protein
MKECIKFWRWQPSSCGIANVDLLHAHYITHCFSRHTHDTYAIGAILAGAEAFSYRGEAHVATAGQVVVINPGEAHTGHAATQDGWTYRMLYPDVALLQQAAIAITGHAQTMPYFPTAVLCDRPLARQLVKLHQALETHSRLEQDSRMLWTMAQLINRHSGDRPSPRPIGQETQAIRQTREYLEAHFAENPSLDELGAIANLSSFYLLRAFRQQVGLPPHEYLNQVRLRRAKQLLANGGAIAQVSHETGFADQSHFTRQFKRMVGVTPGQYRRKEGNFVQD